MIRVIELVWVEDIKTYLPSINDEISEIEIEFNIKLSIKEKNNSDNLPEIAGDIPSSLVFIVDYNLKNNDGSGIDGDEIVKKIRANNPNCTIVFYSANLNQDELRKLIGTNDPHTICVYRPNLLDKLRELVENGEI